MAPPGRNTAPFSGSDAKRGPLMLNGVPKSGTNLVAAILAGLGLQRVNRTHISAYHLVEHPDGAPARRVRQSPMEWHDIFSKCPDTSFIFAHHWHDDKLIAIVELFRSPVVFVYRDPRDVVISRAHYELRTNGKISKRESSRMLRQTASFDRCVEQIIDGIPDLPEDHILRQSVDRSIGRYVGWIKQRNTISVRYEDLVGVDSRTAEGQIRRMAAHSFLNLNDLRLQQAMAALNVRPSTFRKGVVGGWRQEMSKENKRKFKTIAGHLLIELGYEKDYEW